MNFLKALKLAQTNGRVFRPESWNGTGRALFIKKDGSIACAVSEKYQTKSAHFPTAAEFLENFEMANAPEIRIENGRRLFKKLSAFDRIIAIYKARKNRIKK
jgi:hypothetical protein